MIVTECATYYLNETDCFGTRIITYSPTHEQLSINQTTSIEPPTSGMSSSISWEFLFLQSMNLFYRIKF